MSSPMDLFKSVAPQQPAAGAPQPSPAGNIPPGGGINTPPPPGSAANGIVPGVGTPNNPNPSPLDAFDKLWENPTTAGTGADSSIFKVDQKGLMDAASKLDFSKSVTTEQLAAISQGGEAAQQAFVQAMNSVAQGVYAQSAFATTHIVEQALQKAQAAQDKKLPDHIKNFQLNESMRAENPVFSHPATAPLLTAIQSQLTVKNPGASTAEIKQLAMQYLQNFAEGLTPKKAEPVAKNGEIDWSTF